MKYTFIIISVFLITGATCGEKIDRYENAAKMAANPECVKVEYGRDGGDATFMEARCTGSKCEGTGICKD